MFGGSDEVLIDAPKGTLQGPECHGRLGSKIRSDSEAFLGDRIAGYNTIDKPQLASLACRERPSDLPALTGPVQS